MYEEQLAVAPSLGGSNFQGCILSLKVFCNALSAADVLSLRQTQGGVSQNVQIVLSVHAENIKSLTEGDSWLTSAVSIVTASASGHEPVHNYPVHRSLEALAYMKGLVTRTQKDVLSTTAVWGPLKDYGMGRTGTSQFDRLFNKNKSVGSAVEWSLGMSPLPWSLQGDSTSDWVTRARLRNGVGVSQQDFGSLLELSRPNGRIDGAFLNRLTNAANLAKVSGVKVRLLEQFVALVGQKFDSDGAEDVMLVLDALEWIQEAGFDAELALYHLGDSDMPVVTDSEIFALSNLIAGDMENFSVAAESFLKDDMTEGECILMLTSLKTPLLSSRGRLEAVLDKDGLVVAQYFSQEPYSELHTNEDWLRALKHGLLELFEQEYNALISRRKLVDAEMAFGAKGILLKALEKLGYVFGESMHKQFTWDDLIEDLSKSTTVGFAFKRSPEMDKVLRLLADDLLPKWALKAQKIEDTLFKQRAAMEQSLFQATSTVFSVEAVSVEVVINGGCGGLVYSLIQTLLSSTSAKEVVQTASSVTQDLSAMETYAHIKACVKITQLVDRLQMTAFEVHELVTSPIIFSVHADLDRINLSSLAALAEYRRVREYAVQRREDLLDIEPDETIRDLTVLLRSGENLASDAVSNVFAWNGTDTEWIAVKVADHTGRTIGIRRQDLWHICNLYDSAAKLSSNVQSLWNISEADTFSEFKQLTFASTQSLGTIDDEVSERDQKEIVDSVLRTSRDALLGLTVSIVTVGKYQNATIAVGDDDGKYQNATVAVGEYLLLDVETEPPVLASRVQQAIQSVQLYVHRNLLGLERNDMSESSIEHVRTQWNTWLQNYRVWEAARRVYLYPENFIEPELRGDSTPEFAELVKTVSGATDESAISRALLLYVESVEKVLSQLRIVGAGLSTSAQSLETRDSLQSEAVERLVIVGQTKSSPSETFVRVRKQTTNGTKWYPWEKVGHPITANWISPAFAFGKLHLFWISWKEEQVQVYVFNEDTWNVLNQYRQLFAVASKVASETDPGSKSANQLARELQLADAMIELGNRNKRSTDKNRNVYIMEKGMLDDLSHKYAEKQFNEFLGHSFKSFIETLTREVTKTAPLLQPEIQFVSKKLTESWTAPQLYTLPPMKVYGDIAVSSTESVPGEHKVPSWQRLYCVRAELRQDQKTKLTKDVKNPVVLLASESINAEEITSSRSIDKTMTFDFLSRIAPEPEDWRVVFRKLGSESTGTATRSILDEARFFDQPTQQKGIRLLRGGSIFDFDLVMKRKEHWQQLLETLDEGLKSWFDKEGDDILPVLKQETLKNLLEPVQDQMRQFEDDSRSTDEEDMTDHIGEKWGKVLGLNPSSLNDHSKQLEAQTDLYLLAHRLKKAEKYELGFRFKPAASRSSLRSEKTFKPEFIPLPTDLIGKWSHFALEIDLRASTSAVRLKSRKLGAVADAEIDEEVVELTWEAAEPGLPQGIGYFFEIGRSLQFEEGQGMASLQVRCEMSEARIWKANLEETPLDFENVFAPDIEGHRLSPNSSTLVAVAPLDQDVANFSNDASQQFVTATDLMLKVATEPAPDFSSERILIFLQNRVFSVLKGTKQAFSVTMERGSDFDCLQLEMSKDVSSDENSTASIRATVRSHPPQFARLPEDALDFFTGRSDYNIDASKIERLQRSPKWLRDSEPLLQNILWNSSTLQPVQNLFGVSILQTDEDVFLLEAHPDSKKATTRRRLSDYIALEKVKGSLKLSLVKTEDEATLDVAYTLQRLASSAFASFEERLAKGGVDAMMGQDAQLGTESNVVFEELAIEEPAYGQILVPRERTNLAGVVAKASFSNSSSDTGTKSSLPEAFNRVDFHSVVNGLYFWELFLHAPLLIATSLNSGGQFARASRWLEYIFRPIRNEFQNDSFNPWQFQPFVESAKNNGVDAILSILGDGEDAQRSIAAFRKNPFDAHNIAARRQYSYQKNVFYKYVSNLLDHGDSLFIDDRESINKALLYYIQADKVLGRRPREIPRSRNIEDTSPRTIEALREERILMKNFVVPYVENAGDPSTGPLDAVSLMVSFCVPENDRLLQLWSRLEDRLYKIRNSLNIEGTFRQLDLFAPPINPSALVSAVAGGTTALQAAANVRRGVPHYRFDYMLQIAIEAAEATTTMAADMLSAMESRDAEGIAIIEADHARSLNRFMVELRRKHLQAARHGRQALLITVERVEAKINRFSTFLEDGQQFAGQYSAEALGVASSAVKFTEFPRQRFSEFTEIKNKKTDRLLTHELDKLVKSDEAEERLSKAADEEKRDNLKKEVRKRAKEAKKAEKSLLKVKTRERSNAISSFAQMSVIASAEAGARASAGGVQLIPEIQTGTAGLGPLVAASFGGSKLAKGLEIAADVISITTTVIDLVQQFQALEAQKEADRQEWTKERESARLELLETRELLTAAWENENAAESALELAKAEGLAAEVIHAAHSQKFTNVELYNWLSGELRRMYRRMYNVAVEMARDAERGLQFELPTDKSFISGSGWSDARNGLLASKMLHSELRQMANYRVEQHSRFLEIERRISLRREFPEKFQELIENEECELEFSEKLFDKDFAGHYFRVLKTVAVSIIPSGNGRIENQHSLRATLTQSSNRVVMTPDIKTVEYLWDRQGDIPIPDNTKLRSNWRANQTIALSKWDSDMGLFHLSYSFDRRYFSFEGTGAVSTWHLKIPAESNPGLRSTAGTSNVALPALDFTRDENVDIIIKLEYSSKADFGQFQDQVAKGVADAEEPV